MGRYLGALGSASGHSSCQKRQACQGNGHHERWSNPLFQGKARDEGQGGRGQAREDGDEVAARGEAEGRHAVRDRQFFDRARH